ncbi:MAG TPA: hypothetical protein EYG99_01595 [Candidatus Pacebacteria bacterium]|nr:hypothetical protein [Candidatus Paceibacterota bacterium]
MLAGITRQTIIELAIDLDYEVEERDILPSELQNFEGAFFTGTASEITSIKKIISENNQKFIFDSESVKELRNAFSEVISENSTDKKGWFSML